MYILYFQVDIVFLIFLSAYIKNVGLERKIAAIAELESSVESYTIQEQKVIYV